MANQGVRIARIGRQANPAERGLQLVRENEHILERVAQNLLRTETGVYGLALLGLWQGMSPSEQEGYRTRALGLLEIHVENYRPEVSR